MVIIIIIILILYYIFYITRPNYVIYDRIQLKLPKDFEVTYYNHTIIGDYVYAKIKISEESIDGIINQINNEKIFPQYDDNNTLLNDRPNYKYEWFKFDEDDLLFIKRSFRTDRNFKDKHMHDIWFFVCKENDEYYLYLSF